MASKIHYRSGYKYQLAKDFNLKIPVKPTKNIVTQFIDLDTQGNLKIKDGYAWDGVSGPVIDTESNLRASLVHDALYQLIRNKCLKKSKHKDTADKLFRKLCKEDGVLSPVAQAYYEVLRKVGHPAADPKNIKKVHTAP